MTSAEESAAAALKASAAINHGQQTMTEESRLLLAAILRDEMRLAVADGIADAMTDENADRFWRKGLQVLQEQAAKQAGILLWSGIKRAAGIGILVVLVWMVAGVPAAKAVLGAFSKG